MNNTLMQSLDGATLTWLGLILLLAWLGFWLLYRVIRAAVRAGLREAGLSGRGVPYIPRKENDSAHDFVYTEPRY